MGITQAFLAAECGWFKHYLPQIGISGYNSKQSTAGSRGCGAHHSKQDYASWKRKALHFFGLGAKCEPDNTFLSRNPTAIACISVLDSWVGP